MYKPFDEAEEKGRIEGRAAGMAEGMAAGRIEGVREGVEKSLENLTNSLMVRNSALTYEEARKEAEELLKAGVSPK